VPDDRRPAPRVGDQPEPVTVFQQQVGARENVGIAPPDLDDLQHGVGRVGKVAQAHPDHGGLRQIDQEVVEIPAVGARVEIGAEPFEPGDGVGIARQHQNILIGAHEVRPWQQVRALPADGDEVDS
jgi:hypothetical protein